MAEIVEQKPKRDLMGFDRLQDLYSRTTPEELSKLSDEDLMFIKDEAQIMYNFFNNMQLATKLLCNAIYGGLGTPKLRYYNFEVANDITAEGREVCKLMDNTANLYFKKLWSTDYELHKKLAEKFPTFFENITIGEPLDVGQHLDFVIYADTDSNYVVFDYVFETLKLNPYSLPTKETSDFITFFMREKLDPIYDDILTKFIGGRNGKNHMIFELEAVGGFGIWCAKKKYVFAKLWEDGKYIADKGSLKVVGLEIKQKSASKRVKDILKVFVNTIFVRRGKLDSQTFFQMCNSVRKNLQDATVDELAKATKLNNYNKYILFEDENKIEYAPKTPMTVRGASRYNQFIRRNKLESIYPILKDDMFVKVFYDETGQPFTYPADYECPPTAPKISVDIQLEKLVFSPVKRLVDGMIDGDLGSMGRDKVQMGFKKLMNKFN